MKKLSPESEIQALVDLKKLQDHVMTYWKIGSVADAPASVEVAIRALSGLADDLLLRGARREDNAPSLPSEDEYWESVEAWERDATTAFFDTCWVGMGLLFRGDEHGNVDALRKYCPLPSQEIAKAARSILLTVIGSAKQREKLTAA
jgi:hypothetical protein